MTAIMKAKRKTGVIWLINVAVFSFENLDSVVFQLCELTEKSLVFQNNIELISKFNLSFFPVIKNFLIF